MTGRADDDRFLALLDEHKGILYKVANAYCRNHEDRNDLLQEIVIHLWRSFESLRRTLSLLDQDPSASPVRA